MPASLVNDRFCIRQLSCLQNDTQNDYITSALLVEVNISIHPCLLYANMPLSQNK